MGLRILIDDRLNALLLVTGKIKVSEALRPTMLELRWAGVGATGRPGRGRLVLSVGAHRHRKRGDKGGYGEKRDPHGSILARLAQFRLNAGLGPSKRPNSDGVDRRRDVRLEALEVIEEELRELACLLVVGRLVGPCIAWIEHVARHVGNFLGNHQAEERLGFVIVTVFGLRSPH